MNIISSANNQLPSSYPRHSHTLCLEPGKSSVSLQIPSDLFKFPTADTIDNVIFSFLSPVDLSTAAVVNKQWNKLSRNDQLWLSHLKKFNKEASPGLPVTSIKVHYIKAELSRRTEEEEKKQQAMIAVGDKNLTRHQYIWI